MTRETKVGLLIGLGVILLIGIIVSDHLSVVQHQDPARMTEFADRAQESIHPPLPPLEDDAPSPALSEASSPREVSVEPAPATRDQPIYTPNELESEPVMDVPAVPTHPRPPVAIKVAEAPPVRQPDTETQPAPLSITLDARDADRPDPLAAPPPRKPGAEMIHYVQRNENLYKIAEKHYGNGDLWRLIAKRNPESVGPNGQIAAGARLVIPGRNTALAELSEDLVPAGTERVIDITPGNVIVVQGNDTLSALAIKHLGSEGRWPDLFEANRDKLDRPEDLKVGMKLKLPDQAEAAQPQPAAPPSAAENVYVVQPNDNLTRIAERKLGDGDRWRDIFDANRDKLASADDVKVGQKLVLPE